MIHSDIIIIGGGLSGLSAAVELSAKGRKVLLLEQRQHCGGRSYSFFDSATGSIVDNGQHLMMGCYRAARRYMQIIGTEYLAFLQPALRINFLRPPRPLDCLSCSRLPAPLHLLSGFLGFHTLSVKDRLSVFLIAKELVHTSPAKETELDRLTVEEWLVRHGQSDFSRKYFWNVLTVGALNNDPKKVSALMLFRVLRAAFLGARENSSLLIPRTGLSELFVEPALKFIRSKGGEVRTGIGVDRMTIKGTRFHSVRTSDGKILTADSFISAVPWYSFRKFQWDDSGNSKPRGKILEPLRVRIADSFRSSPIISIHLWLDKEVTSLDMTALLDTNIQWIFNKNEILNERGGKTAARQYLSLVISAAEKYTAMKKQELVDLAMKDLRKVLPGAANASVIRSIVIKEKQATFIPSPGLETHRPAARTMLDNFFLAGDWTDTGYPATIEGAVMSGQTAAKLIS